MEPLPFGILSEANPTIKMGAIVMDGVAINTAKLTVGVCQPLQPWVLSPELCICAAAWHKVPTHLLRSHTCPRTCVSHHNGGGIKVGVGNRARTNVRMCILPQGPPAQPLVQTAVARVAAAVCTVSSTARKARTWGRAELLP